MSPVYLRERKQVTGATRNREKQQMHQHGQLLQNSQQNMNQPQNQQSQHQPIVPLQNVQQNAQLDIDKNQLN